MKKATANYMVDAVLGVAFLGTLVSGLVFLIPTSWIDFTVSTTPTVLGLGFGFWQNLHKYTGIAIYAGVLTHLVLHFNWIVSMTKKILTPGKQKKGQEPKLELAEEQH